MPPLHEGLKLVSPTNKLFIRLLNYLSSRLSDTVQKRSAREAEKGNRFGHKLELVLKDLPVDSSDGIVIFGFFGSPTREADLALLTDAHFYLFL